MNNEKLSRIVGLRLLAIREGAECGAIREVVMDVDKKSVEFLVLDTGKGCFGFCVLPNCKIAGMGKDFAITNSSEYVTCIWKEEEAMKLAYTDSDLIGARVVSSEGDVIGKIVDFEFQLVEGTIEKYIMEDGSVLPKECIVTLSRGIIFIDSDLIEPDESPIPQEMFDAEPAMLFSEPETATEETEMAMDESEIAYEASEVSIEEPEMETEEFEAAIEEAEEAAYAPEVASEEVEAVADEAELPAEEPVAAQEESAPVAEPEFSIDEILAQAGVVPAEEPAPAAEPEFSIDEILAQAGVVPAEEPAAEEPAAEESASGEIDVDALIRQFASGASEEPAAEPPAPEPEPPAAEQPLASRLAALRNRAPAPAAAPANNDTKSYFEKRRAEYVIGKTVKTRVTAADGAVLADVGQIVTQEMVDAIAGADKLTELTMSVN